MDVSEVSSRFRWALNCQERSNVCLTVKHADVIVRDVSNALDLFLKPKRPIAAVGRRYYFQPKGKDISVRGVHTCFSWAAVESKHCGLSSTFREAGASHERGVRDVGGLTQKTALQLAGYTGSNPPVGVDRKEIKF
jgi:hypothetical protein